MKPLSSSPYSYHFAVLTVLGFWLYNSDGKPEKRSTKRNHFIIFRSIIAALAACGLLGLFINLIVVMGDMKKVTWNLCVTTIFIGSLSKNAVMNYKHITLNNLRMMLHQDAESRQDPEDILIHDMALKEFKYIRMAFYGVAIICAPIWLVFRYIGNELPLPISLPGLLDLNNKVIFNIFYFIVGCGGVLGIVMTSESELAMYSILVQIWREYKILLKDINKINQLYDDNDNDSTRSHRNSHKYSLQNEINPWLKKMKTRFMVRNFSRTQTKIFNYTETFESCFNKPLLIQFLSMSYLIVALALQLLWETVDFSGNFLYQIGYLYSNVMDMFSMCLYSTRIRSLCLNVGETIYSTVWYKMDRDIQRDLQMIIMRSQRPPKITISKFLELSLSTFMNTMSHLYSWLALFRQFE